MIKHTYQSIRTLCVEVLSTLQCDNAKTHANTMDLASFCLNSYGSNPAYLVQSFNVDTINIKYLRLQSSYIRTNNHTNPSYLAEHHLKCFNIRKELRAIQKTPVALVNCSVETIMTDKSTNYYDSAITVNSVFPQKGAYPVSNLCGGMYAPNNDNSNMLWNVLKNKLDLIGQEPYDCQSSPGNCFFASLGHALYRKPSAHFQIRNAGITHLVNNPELYIESLADRSWESYIQDMSQPGTCCDNIIMQAVANALSCTIHITDSSTNANPTIINPVSLDQRQKVVFLGYINNLHYVSTLPNTNTGSQTDNKEKKHWRKNDCMLGNNELMKALMQKGFGLKNWQSIKSQRAHPMSPNLII